jgi:hypothetical protein
VQSPTTSDGGADAGLTDAAAASAGAADAAVADGGDAGSLGMPCQRGSGDGDSHGLVQPFAFDDSSNDVEYTVTTHATSGSVDFTSFKDFVFDARLMYPTATPLPPGTGLRVELICMKNQGENFVTQDVPIADRINAQTWGPPFRLHLAQFQFMLTSAIGSCLSQVDGIRFVVSPGQNDQPAVVGTLSLDNISLQN